MATKNFCDGTGLEIPDDTPTTGVFKRQYCNPARIEAEKYLAELDELHTWAAQLYEAKREELRARYRAELQHLPDEPQ